jgi:hypothetical protein
MNRIRTSNNDGYERFRFWNSENEFINETEKMFENTDATFEAKELRLARMPRESFEGSSDIQELSAPITSFLHQDKLNEFIESAAEIINRIDLGGSFDKNRVIATDQPVGVFDFSLASKGLFIPMEYYCKELETVIPADDVKKISSNPDVFYYYEKQTDGSVKPFSVLAQQKGTYFVQKKELLVAELMKKGYGLVPAKAEASLVYPNAKLKFATTTKKVYLIRKNKSINDKKGNEKYVDLFVIVGGQGYYTPISILYKILPSLLTAYFLNKAGIKTRIIGTLALEKSAGKVLRASLNSFVVKDYSDSFNFNKIAIALADTRVFRWKYFRSIIGLYDANQKDKNGKGYDVGKGLGTILGMSSSSSSALPLQLEKTFERYKTWYLNTYPTAFNKNRSLMVMSCINFSENIVNNEKAMTEIAMEDFYKIINAIDIEFNDAPTAISKIRTRDLKTNTDPRTIKSRISAAIMQLTTFDDSDSKNSNTDEYIESQENKRFNMLSELNRSLK